MLLVREGKSLSLRCSAFGVEGSLDLVYIVSILPFDA